MQFKNITIIQVMNTTYGAKGQIGYRAQFIKKKLDEDGVENVCLARDSGIGGKNVYQVLPLGQIIPRALNAYRMFVNPRFDNRKYDAPLFDYFADRRLRKALKKYNTTPVVVHFWEYSPRLIKISREAGAKVVVDVPIAPSHEALRLERAGLQLDTPIPGINIREEEAIISADLLLAPSSYISDILTGIGVSQDKIIINPFGCEIGPLVIKKKRGGALVYLFVGTLSKRKGLKYLLEAWSKGPFSKDRLLLCGRLTKNARAILNKYKFSNVVTTGHVDIGPYLKQSDIFVLPTLMEGSSKAVYEAMAAGLPVISTPSSGTVAEDGKEALIVPIGDAEKLCQAMVKLKESSEMRAEMGQAARAKVKEYSWERYARGVISVYRQALKL